MTVNICALRAAIAATLTSTMTLLTAAPGAAFDLFQPAPQASRADTERCPRGYATYRIDWMANMDNEFSPSGQPTMAYAVSPDGPGLPVGLSFGGLTRRFEFDRPRVSGFGNGFLELAQNLLHHDEYTTVEITFDRDVYDLHMDVHDVDEKVTFSSNGYSDRLVIEGRSHSAPAFHFSPMTVEADRTMTENNARRKLNERLGRPETRAMVPILRHEHSREDFAPQTAVFINPVGAVRIVFGTDPDRFPSQGYGVDPTPQAVAIADTSFCVPFTR